ncbi:MAG: cupin domain-containing protein [Anaerolineaceae bacterium]|nr:cupin domain-containing protein [Anaerolineaceae bacterium]
MTFSHLENLPKKNAIPGGVLSTIHTENVTITYWDFEPGALIPAHAHSHEQVTILLDGEFRMKVGDETEVMKGGSFVTIQPDEEHSGEALSTCKLMDVFYPVREDFK